MQKFIEYNATLNEYRFVILGHPVLKDYRSGTYETREQARKYMDYAIEQYKEGAWEKIEEVKP